MAKPPAEFENIIQTATVAGCSVATLANAQCTRVVTVLNLTIVVYRTSNTRDICIARECDAVTNSDVSAIINIVHQCINGQ